MGERWGGGVSTQGASCCAVSYVSEQRVTVVSPLLGFNACASVASDMGAAGRGVTGDAAPLCGPRQSGGLVVAARAGWCHRGGTRGHGAIIREGGQGVGPGGTVPLSLRSDFHAP